MASIWQKTFGKFNKKKNITRQLAEEIIEFKNNFGYDTVSEAVVTIGTAYKFAKDMTYHASVYDSWASAKDYGVLDKAVKMAIENDRDNDDDTPEQGGLAIA